ncbi:MAG: lipid-A-disaccharide synthase N-terminal domain-containing protein [Odoribacter sp.]|nr:lipid-A-disaccharide synthase N-terminal domain-containing protein [Odoribacter sp.]MDY3033949.1 lipid-A-disaccharide synthase N-terminal domain-containing protein [Odoribacter sp.]
MIYIIGFLAQVCFSGRLLFQWIMSEKAKQVVSPSIFWLLSLLGSYLLFFYGWLRSDFAIILGQLISYYIYIWNLDIKNEWKKIPRPIRYLLIATPFMAIGYMLNELQDFIREFFHNEDIPLWLLIWGSLGQIIFTLRFIYQWIYSRKRQKSLLPLGFWVISLTGSCIIVSYALVRHDPVLILGQSTGLIVYIRNIWIMKHPKKE